MADRERHYRREPRRREIAEVLFKTFIRSIATLRFKSFAVYSSAPRSGDDRPIITSDARSPPQLELALKENMVFIFKPSVRSADGNSVCTWGDTVVITANGSQRLGKRAHDLAVSASR
jgi:hypothetical protein